jgi:hypothetical protein
MTRRLIAFRFDRDPVVCRDHIAHLRRLNPGVPIVGIFGGDPFKRVAFRFGRRFVLGLDGFFASAHRGRWNWMRGDVVLRSWFEEAGHELSFDVVHSVEWDLVVLDTLDNVYGHVPAEAVALTALRPVREIEDTWVWTSGDNRADWLDLLAFARDRLGYSGEPYGCYGGGPCIPRVFLERYAELDVPIACMEELRLPLLAQVFGLELVDTRLKKAWGDRSDDHVFNVGGPSIAREVIDAELLRPDGRRAFHPVRYRLDRRLRS